MMGNVINELAKSDPDERMATLIAEEEKLTKRKRVLDGAQAYFDFREARFEERIQRCDKLEMKYKAKKDELDEFQRSLQSKAVDLQEKAQAADVVNRANLEKIEQLRQENSSLSKQLVETKRQLQEKSDRAEAERTRRKKAEKKLEDSRESGKRHHHGHSDPKLFKKPRKTSSEPHLHRRTNQK